jgi:hypothetical protein
MRERRWWTLWILLKFNRKIFFSRVGFSSPDLVAPVPVLISRPGSAHFSRARVRFAVDFLSAAACWDFWSVLPFSFSAEVQASAVDHRVPARSCSFLFVGSLLLKFSKVCWFWFCRFLFSPPKVVAAGIFVFPLAKPKGAVRFSTARCPTLEPSHRGDFSSVPQLISAPAGLIWCLPLACREPQSGLAFHKIFAIFRRCCDFPPHAWFPSRLSGSHRERTEQFAVRDFSRFRVLAPKLLSQRLLFSPDLDFRVTKSRFFVQICAAAGFCFQLVFSWPVWSSKARSAVWPLPPATAPAQSWFCLTTADWF